MAHKSCKDKFPHNCGLNEGQFAATLRSIGVDPSVLGRKIQEPDEAAVNHLLERQNTLDDVAEKRLSIIENIDMSLGSMRTRVSQRLMVPQDCSLDDFNIISMIGGGSFGKVICLDCGIIMSKSQGLPGRIQKGSRRCVCNQDCGQGNLINNSNLLQINIYNSG